jgi:LacI family transcriptional regulator
MATIRSIAEAANVSRGTVDKVLNDRPGVSMAVRERVRQIAEEMGYKPNLAGKALAFQKKDIRIGILVPSAADPLFLEVFEGVRRGIAEYANFGIQFEVIEMTQSTAEHQLSCIHTLLDRKISGLVISPFDDEKVRQALLELRELGIPVVTFNTDLSGIGRLCYVGQDSRRSGRVAADLMCKILSPGSSIVCITGPAVFKSLSDRLAGFRSLIKAECPELILAAVLHNDNTSESAYQVTRDYLRSGKPADAFYMTSSGIDGMVRAIRQYGKPGTRVVCFDMIPSTRQLMLDGQIDFSILQEPDKQGYEPIKILVDLLFYNRKVTEKYQFTRIDIRTRENID